MCSTCKSSHQLDHVPDVNCAPLSEARDMGRGPTKSMCTWEKRCCGISIFSTCVAGWLVTFPFWQAVNSLHHSLMSAAKPGQTKRLLTNLVVARVGEMVHMLEDRPVVTAWYQWPDAACWEITPHLSCLYGDMLQLKWRGWQHSLSFWARDLVGCHFVCPRHIVNFWGILRHVGQMALLTSWPRVRHPVQSVGQRFVVGENDEAVPLQQEPEVSYGRRTG